MTRQGSSCSTSDSNNVSYEEALIYLYAQLPMYQRVGKAAYKADLSNTIALMDLLGHPERSLRCVHVAGTNGKGSTSHLISSVLQEAGYKVGLHTSPHLKDMRERFRINGVMVPEETVVRFVEDHRKDFETIDASFFEWGVALAFWWFREQAVDIAVIETGMGGRLDSTNVICPEVSVITNIGWDHMDFLGSSLEAIAGEKAGIIKQGIPVVLGDADGPLAEVFRQKALSVSAPFTLVDQQSELTVTSPLAGSHQQRNARTALAALEVLRKGSWTISDEAIAKGFTNVLPNTGLRGRWEVLSTAPLTIADVAHNVDGMRAMRATLNNTPHKKLHLVLGTVNDKDLGQVLAELPPEANYYFAKADIPRGLEASALQDQAKAFGLLGAAYSSVSEAYSAARSAAASEDLVLITGSVFVVAEIL